MIEHTATEKIATVCSVITYTISGWVGFGHIMDYLNENDGAFAVILGFMTFLGQMFFSYLRHRNEKLRLKKFGEKDE